MSFSSDIKREILENRAMSRQHGRAQALGMLLFARSFGPEEIALVTEYREIAALAVRHVWAIAGDKRAARLDAAHRSGREQHTVTVPEEADRLRLLEALGQDGGVHVPEVEWEEAGAFLSGAFLSCGSMTDPAKGYHLEFAVRKTGLRDGLGAVLEEVIPGVKRTTRRNSSVCYYKECSQIEDLLTLMGAPKASLAMIDVEMIKQVRNQANRVTNCETANIDKMVSAAAGQIAAIRRIMESGAMNGLPEELREIARLRMDNPDLSLRELGALLERPVSRSGLHRRLDKIVKFAADLDREHAG